jgi:hypothetical protein
MGCITSVEYVLLINRITGAENSFRTLLIIWNRRTRILAIKGTMKTNTDLFQPFSKIPRDNILIVVPFAAREFLTFLLGEEAL